MRLKIKCLRIAVDFLGLLKANILIDKVNCPVVPGPHSVPVEKHLYKPAL